MKKGVTYVDRARIEQAIKELGLDTEKLATWLKVTGPVGNTRRLYVPLTKRVGRIDLSGFEVTGDDAHSPDHGVFGRVRQQLRMEGSEEEVIARFKKVARLMMSGKQTAEDAGIPVLGEKRRGRPPKRRAAAYPSPN